VDPRTIIDSNQYLTLATTDLDGRPWVTPVWFADDGPGRFLWVSRPEARHSRNLRSRPDVALVVFDSTVAIGTGQGLYAEGRAAEMAEVDVPAGIERFSARSLAMGGVGWSDADVTGDAPFRLYAAVVSSAWMLDGHDHRVEVDLR
jgi:hypothetical protein